MPPEGRKNSEVGVGGWGGSCVRTESAGAKEQGLQLVGRKAQVGVHGPWGPHKPMGRCGGAQGGPNPG